MFGVPWKGDFEDVLLLLTAQTGGLRCETHTKRGPDSHVSFKFLLDTASKSNMRLIR